MGKNSVRTSKKMSTTAAKALASKKSLALTKKLAGSTLSNRKRTSKK